MKADFTTKPVCRSALVRISGVFSQSTLAESTAHWTFAAVIAIWPSPAFTNLEHGSDVPD